METSFGSRLERDAAKDADSNDRAWDRAPTDPAPIARERLTPDVGSAEVRISTLEENESFSNFPKALHGPAKELWAWHSCLYE